MPFEKGKSGNPAGRPSGRQAFIDRAQRFLEDHTVDDLIALAQDRSRFGKLCVYDALIVSRIAAALMSVTAKVTKMKKLSGRVRTLSLN